MRNASPSAGQAWVIRARLAVLVRRAGRVVADPDSAIGWAGAVIFRAELRGRAALAGLVALAGRAADLADLVDLVTARPVADALDIPADLAADARRLAAAVLVDVAGRADECRTTAVLRWPAGRADFTDAVVAAAVRAFAALVMALVALFIACMAVDMVLADAVALVAAEVILADAVVTLAAADETVLVDALAGVDLTVRRAPLLAVMVLRVLPIERPAALPDMLVRIARSFTACAGLRRAAVWVLLCVGIDLPRVDQ